MADLWSSLRVRQMTVDDAKKIAGWRYAGEWSVYELSSAKTIIDNLASYYTVAAGETLVGFYCTGAAARVSGMTVNSALVDVGTGMNPSLIGRGHGAAFGQAVLNHLSEAHPGRRLRAVVQSWNQRSLRMTRRLGFEDVGDLTVVQDGRPVAYRVLMKR